MFVIYDDIIKDLQTSGGISVYWDNLKKHLEKKITSLSFNGKNNNRDLNLIVSIQRYLYFRLDLDHDHIFHSSYYRISKNRKSKNVVTVHDFVYEYYSSGLKKFIHTFQKKNAILNADRIICVSENTKKDLLKFYPQVKKNTIKVIYHGVGNEFFKINNNLSNKMLNLRSLIFVGKRGGYKNFEIVLKILSGNLDFNLIIVGGGTITKNEKLRLKKISYKHYLNPTNSELNNLYNNSFALIYPSLYEGFGFPIIESLKAGCPVICNDGSSTKEIGNKYVLKGKMNESFIVKSLNKLKNEEFREKLIHNGIKYASSYTWENTAKETLNLYEELWKEFQ